MDSKGVAVRNFRQGDLESIVDFKRESAAVSFPGRGFSEESFRKEILKRTSKNPESIKIAEKDGKVVGYVYFKIVRTAFGRSGVINHVFVDREHRRMGLGQRLMEVAEDHLRSQDLERIRVTITKTNEPSLRMCRRLGYREKRLVMEKELD